MLFGRQYKHFYKLLKSGIVLPDRRIETLEFTNCTEFLEFNNSTNLEQDWSAIPFMNKELRFKYQNKSISGVFSVETGGVLGKPANFLQNNEVWYKEMAYIDYLFEHLGLKRNAYKLSFRGGEFGLAKEGVWYENPLHQEISFSPFSMDTEAIEVLKSILKKYKPVIWYGYPSAFKSLFIVLESEAISLEFVPETLLLISESFTQTDLNFFKSHLPQTRITSFYGLSERCVFGFPQDGDISGYKLDTNYGYVELVDNEGNVITEEGVLGEIVATTYDNYAMPLIRYRTGDYTRWKDYAQRNIGLIEGKWSGIGLIDKNGHEISLTAINFHAGEWSKVELIQFQQISPGLVSVSIKGVKIDGNQELIDSLNNRVGNSIRFIQNPNNDFVKTKRGKTPLLIMDLS